MKIKTTTLSILACSALGVISSQAATLLLTDTEGRVGELLDEVASGTFEVPEIPGLFITIVSVSSTGTGSGTLELNGNSSSFGVNSLGTTNDAPSAFDELVSEVATFSFDKAVEITSVSFSDFSGTDVFEFGGVSIPDSAAPSNTFTFVTPLAIAANTSFSMRATTGSVGVTSFDVNVVPEPSAALLGAFGFLALLRRRR